MDVVGHDDVAVNEELVAFAEGFEDFFKCVAGAAVVEEGEPVVAGEGDEVVLIEGLVALQSARHRASFVSANWLGWPIHRVLCDEWGTEGGRAVSFAWWCGWLRFPTHAAKCCSVP